MNLIRRITSVLALSTAFVMGLPVSSAQAQGTAFTYQGHLQAASAEASGIYDFKFRLYDAPTGGAQIGSELAVSGITINDGRFSLSLDFGEAYDGTPRWLEIEVANAGAGAYTLLSPRQAITPAPQAIYASKAGEATTATVAMM